MKAVIQRVTHASVQVGGQAISRIDRGILTLLGVVKGDAAAGDRGQAKLEKLIRKICELRIFPDEAGKMNRSLVDIGGGHLIVSQFTLAGDCSQGRRPSFIEAESPELARDVYERAIAFGRSLGIATEGGVFQADMRIALENDGPVTFVIDV